MLRLYFDRIAIALSGTCVVHCIALPIVVAFIPLLDSVILHSGNALHEFWFHQFILLFILPISILALISGYRYHKKLIPILVSGAGLLVLTFTAIFVETLIEAHIIPHAGETWLTMFGGLIHALGHILNYRGIRGVPAHCATASKA